MKNLDSFRACSCGDSNVPPETSHTPTQPEPLEARHHVSSFSATSAKRPHAVHRVTVIGRMDKLGMFSACPKLVMHSDVQKIKIVSRKVAESSCKAPNRPTCRVDSSFNRWSSFFSCPRRPCKQCTNSGMVLFFVFMDHYGHDDYMMITVVHLGIWI